MSSNNDMFKNLAVDVIIEVLKKGKLQDLKTLQSGDQNEIFNLVRPASSIEVQTKIIIPSQQYDFALDEEISTEIQHIKKGDYNLVLQNQGKKTTILSDNLENNEALFRQFLANAVREAMTTPEIKNKLQAFDCIQEITREINSIDTRLKTLKDDTKNEKDSLLRKQHFNINVNTGMDGIEETQKELTSEEKAANSILRKQARNLTKETGTDGQTVNYHVLQKDRENYNILTQKKTYLTNLKDNLRNYISKGAPTEKITAPTGNAADKVTLSFWDKVKNFFASLVGNDQSKTAQIGAKATQLR